MYVCIKYLIYSVFKMVEIRVVILCSLIYSKVKGFLC